MIQKIFQLENYQKNIICKKVIAYDPITKDILGIYESSSKAGEKLNISQSTISRKCTGKTKNKGNIYFKYA